MPSLFVVLFIVSLLPMTLAVIGGYAAILFLLCRLLHPIFYMLNQATFRSLVFFVGWLANLYIIVKSFLAISI